MFRQMDAGRGRHVRVDHVDNSGGRFIHAHVQPLGDTRDGRAGELSVEAHPAADQATWRNVAQHQIRVGNRRLLATPSVTRWPWHRAGAFRTNLQQPQRIDPGDAPTAGADFEQVNRWHP